MIRPTPTPSPFIVHVVSDGGAPVWLAPLLTGCFVLIASLIAVASLRASDARKLRREDQRQWDRDLREAYGEIAGELQSISRAFSAMQNSVEVGEVNVQQDVELRRLVREATAVIQRNKEALELTAPPVVTQVLGHVDLLLASIWIDFLQTSFDGSSGRWGWLKSHEDPLTTCQQELSAAVRTALRI